MRISFLSVLAVCVFGSILSAHPVPKDNHDRTIVVRLQKGEKPSEVRVRVEYRVEVDETTIYLNDMKDFRDTVNPLDFRGRPLDYYAEFAKIYGPIYADRLVVRVNKKEIDDFRVLSRKERLEDEDGMKLGHLRCDFVFESSFSLEPNAETKFRIREQNYLFDDGQVVMSLVDETELAVKTRVVPDDPLRKRIAEKSATPDDESRAREITIVFAAPKRTADEPQTPEERPTETAPAPPALKTQDHQEHWFSFEQVFFATNYGIFLTLVLCFAIGAGHALTPGHGKTLVAAYLVGERGTIWHACYLGLVTTLTHTGAVISVAVIWVFLPTEHQHTFKIWLQNGLGLIMGVIVTCMGFALLLQRLAGRADHIHLDGGHHHHPHIPETASGPIKWRGLTLLGITGGMIPCWDAITVLVASLGRKEFWFVLAAVLTFSAGLAVVLVAIGILVVQAPRLVESRLGGGRLLRALPIVSAIVVTLMGVWLCYEGVHGK